MAQRISPLPRPILTADLVARLPLTCPDPGPMPVEANPDEVAARAAAMARQLLDDLGPEQPLWVLAVGSILWKCRFQVDERRVARVQGWHRRFALGPDTRYRGSPDAPGIMLTLDRGGACQGEVLRMVQADRLGQLTHLLENEPPDPPRWVRAVTPLGTVRAIAFATPRDRPYFLADLSEDEIADRLASAVGMWGSMAEYLHRTVQALQGLGLSDAMLWRMQAKVAARLQALPE